jgi:putative transposase
MLKAYKYRLYPTKDQQLKIGQTIDVCRLVYNLALETKIRAWQSAQKSLSSYELTYQLPELKAAYPWIAEVDSQAVSASVNKLDNAFKGFFKGKGFPKFKSRKKGTQSFQCPNNTRRVNWGVSTLTIPKIKHIPIVLSKKFDGKIKTITISKTQTGKYFASILVETNDSVLAKQDIDQQTTIGIDVGIKSFAVCSNGLIFESNRYLKTSLNRLRFLQRRASRKKKGSNNRKKANKCVSILHERIANQRLDYIHKVTTKLIRDNQVDTFVIENLNVAGMLKNRKLSQALSDVSFGEFRRQMTYKCEWYGKNLIVIDRFSPSSKRCSDCGEINNELTLADREWTCVCGSHHNRDLNAAKNIKHFGLQQTIFKNNAPEGIGGEPVESRRLRRAKKQEFVPTGI